jgi:hypothetical protein
MTRVKISAGILLFLVAFGVFSGVWMNAGCRRIQRDIGAVSAAARAGEDCAESAAKLTRDWDRFRGISVMMIKNDRIAEIDRTVAQVEYLAGESGSDELPAELTELWHMVELMRKNELPTLTSVL